MNSVLILVFFPAICTHGVYGSIYHGPTAKPVVLHNGYLADTHEVAAARNAHIAAQGTQHNHGVDYGHQGSYGEEHSDPHGDIRYHGPTAIPHVLHDGHIADTDEVAAAKAEHFAFVAKSKAHGAYNQEHTGSHGDITYHGPTAIPHVLHDGHIADTDEVAAAKAEHFATVAKANPHGSYGGQYSDGDATGFGPEYGHSHHVVPYHGSLAKPVVLKSGYLADTHEVAAAKQQHNEALKKFYNHGHL